MSEENDSIAAAVSPYKNLDVKNKKILGFTCGAFDLLHAGHALMLAEAKEQCDYLIVAVQSDPSIDRPEKNSPVQSYEERLTMVRSIRWVDDVICYDTEKDLYDLLVDISPDVRVVGADWKGKKFTGHDLDINVYFNTRDHGWSTSDLRTRVHAAEQKKILEDKRQEASRLSTANLDIADKVGKRRV